MAETMTMQRYVELLGTVNRLQTLLRQVSDWPSRLHDTRLDRCRGNIETMLLKLERMMCCIRGGTVIVEWPAVKEQLEPLAQSIAELLPVAREILRQPKGEYKPLPDEAF